MQWAIMDKTKVFGFQNQKLCRGAFGRRQQNGERQDDEFNCGECADEVEIGIGLHYQIITGFKENKKEMPLSRGISLSISATQTEQLGRDSGLFTGLQRCRLSGQSAELGD